MLGGRGWWVGLALIATAAAAATVVATGGSPATATGGDDGPPGIVMAEPRQGDAAVYDLVDDRGEDRRIVQAWNGTLHPLPDGTTLALASHQTASGSLVEAHAGEASDGDELAADLILPGLSVASDRSGLAAEGEDEVKVLIVDRGFTELPGDPALRSLQFAAVQNTEEARHLQTYRSTDLSAEERPCGGAYAPLLVERSPTEAEEALERCLDQRASELEGHVETSVESRWTTSERFEHVWEANVTVEHEQEGEVRQVVTTLRTTPATSLLLDSTVHADGGEESQTPTMTLEMVSWQAGEGELPAGEAVPSMPSVDLVDWTDTGPVEGEHPVYALAQARDAVEREPEGQRYFAEAEDPRIERARFVVQPRDTATVTALQTRNGAACEQEAPIDEELPEPGDRLRWSVFWTDEDEGRLWGVTSAPRATRDNALDRGIPVEQARAHPFEMTWLEGPPSLRGPAIADLWAQRALVDEVDGDGARMVGVSPDVFQEEAPLDGFVGRVSCDASSANAETFEETKVVFSDGDATELRQRRGMTIHEDPDELPLAVPAQPSPVPGMRTSTR